MKVLRNVIIILLSCVVIATAAYFAYQHIQGEHSREQDMLREQQRIQETLNQIDSRYNAFLREDDRLKRIEIYNSLLAYEESLPQADAANTDISLRLTTVFGNMRNAFSATYNDMIDSVDAKTTATLNEIDDYAKQVRAELDESFMQFGAVEDLTATLIDGDDGELGEEKVELLREMQNRRDIFAEDLQLAGKLTALAERYKEMEGIKAIIASDGILTQPEQTKRLFDRIDDRLERYAKEMDSDVYEQLLSAFDLTIDRARTWFDAYYEAQILKIAMYSLEGSDDTRILQRQVDELRALRSEVENDGIIDSEQVIARINDHITAYEQRIRNINTRRQQEIRQQQQSDELPGNFTAFAGEVLRLVNIERENAGLRALSRGDATLDAAAYTRAVECIRVFSHTRPDGRDCFTAYTDLGGTYNMLGENIAVGYATPEAVMQGWMNSPGHRDNIMRSDFTELSVGVVQDSNGRYHWAQMFRA